MIEPGKRPGVKSSIRRGLQWSRLSLLLACLSNFPTCWEMGKGLPLGAKCTGKENAPSDTCMCNLLLDMKPAQRQIAENSARVRPMQHWALHFEGKHVPPDFYWFMELLLTLIPARSSISVWAHELRGQLWNVSERILALELPVASRSWVEGGPSEIVLHWDSQTLNSALAEKPIFTPPSPSHGEKSQPSLPSGTD